MYTVICDTYYNRRRKTAAATDRKGGCGFMTTGGGGVVGNVVYKYNIYYTNMVVVYWSPGINHIFICVGTWRVLYPFAPPPCAVVCCIPIYTYVQYNIYYIKSTCSALLYIGRGFFFPNVFRPVFIRRGRINYVNRLPPDPSSHPSAHDRSTLRQSGCSVHTFAYD